ncbi:MULTISPECIES: TetR/AcrR family transcriptional regulator [Microbacterium]|uniref:TetR/AcrR family transcriptional regulator n=1 Tax=Microbacterium TaxID=33882 RepID=UPI001469DA51|nr:MULTISPECIES: TetR/AcrR family transcriptional regulator [Microbacterium]
MREEILATARRLTLQRGLVPSLNSVTEAAGISKGGLIHHFPTRAALVIGLARTALAEVDRAMTAAAAEGRAAEEWIRLSLPNREERELMQALASAYLPGDARFDELLAEARAATARWEAMIATEVGDPVHARVIRLVGDALVANAVAGLETAPSDIDGLLAFLLSRATGDSGP